MKVDHDCDIIFFVQIVKFSYSWNKCFVIYQTNADKNAAACRNTSSQAVKLEMRRLQHICILQSWHHSLERPQSYVLLCPEGVLKVTCDDVSF